MTRVCRNLLKNKNVKKMARVWLHLFKGGKYKFLVKRKESN
jgi:hypothetical protein